ncbi:hypothetical protein IT6_03525 [Methylacidiphilum caldifontis]|uniref:hypothetical protein n=1 Tax=Methylacidiphilum caldifontis TaxID=2795386 RepID=UPI001A906386|nr:hypothetical protein [Methylacidiphilum caldifontis]QSR89362.1 hypothetical protein IT6_03525 [Methylacidiphilum caldifontis]
MASTLGRKFGVQVAIGGDQAATDGKAIVLTASAMDEVKTVLWGYLAQEAGHVRPTDFEIFKDVADWPLRKATLNVLKDIQIELACGFKMDILPLLVRE